MDFLRLKLKPEGAEGSNSEFVPEGEIFLLHAFLVD